MVGPSIGTNSAPWATPRGGGTPVPPLTASGIVADWNAASGTTVGTQVSIKSTSPATTPNGSTAAVFPDTAGYGLVITPTSNLSSTRPVYVCGMLLTNADGTLGDVVQTASGSLLFESPIQRIDSLASAVFRFAQNTANNFPSYDTAGALTSGAQAGSILNRWAPYYVEFGPSGGVNRMVVRLPDGTDFTQLSTSNNTGGIPTNLTPWNFFEQGRTAARILVCTNPGNWLDFASAAYGTSPSGEVTDGAIQRNVENAMFTSGVNAGYEFVPTTDLTVTHFQCIVPSTPVYDERVTIYAVSGAVPQGPGTVTVPVASGTPGEFAEAAVTPFVLSSGTAYRIGHIAATGLNRQVPRNPRYVQVSPDLTVTNPGLFNSSGTPAMPSSNSSSGYLAPSFRFTT